MNLDSFQWRMQLARNASGIVSTLIVDLPKTINQELNLATFVCNESGEQLDPIFTSIHEWVAAEFAGWESVSLLPAEGNNNE